MANYTFDALVSEYAQRWSAMRIDPGTEPLAKQVAKRLYSHIERYQAVAKATGVPAAVVACIHEREASGTFDTFLGNGEPLNRKTRLVPKGEGPFQTWEEGAIRALHIDHLDAVNGWTIERALYEFEVYNGFGYRNHGCASAYVWSGSNQYTGGKYVADGVFDKNARDQQIGAAILLECLTGLDTSLGLKRDIRRAVQPATPPPPDIPAPKPQPDGYVFPYPDPSAPWPTKPVPTPAGHAGVGGAAGGLVGGVFAGMDNANAIPWLLGGVLAGIVIGIVIHHFQTKPKG